MWKISLVLVIILAAFEAQAAYENITTKCRHQFDHFNDALKNQRTWAMSMYDTWGKAQSGVLNGNTLNFGQFESCIGFLHHTAIQDVGSFRGKHCMISYRGPNLPEDDFNITFGLADLGKLANSKSLQLYTGICVPESCSADDAREIAIYVMSDANLNVTSATCESNHLIPFRIRIVAIIIFGLLLLAVILATIYELNMKHQQKSPCMTLIAFSAYSNCRSLFEIKSNEASTFIVSLDGLRALSLLWTIFGHRYFDTFATPATNTKSALEIWLRNIFSLAHTTNHLAMDTFFLITALLATWTFMGAFDARKFNILKIFFHRFLRYTPVLLFLILFFVSFAPYLGSGPIYDRVVESWLSNCYNFWWSTLLHVANYTNIDRLCLKWTWYHARYVCAEFQLFVISPFLAYPAWRWKWKFFFVFPLLTVLSKVYIFAVSLINEFPVFVGPLRPEKQFDYDRLLFFPTHARCGPWFVGMTLGFILYQRRNQPPRLSRNVIRLLWVVSVSVMFAVILGYYPFQQESSRDIPNIVAATYNAFFRSSWAVAIAWIIFGCQSGSGGIIRWFLCLPHFQPIARMSVSIYLTHRVHQILGAASIKQPIHLDPLQIFHVFLGDALLSFIIGVVVYICIEAPFATLENRVYKKIYVPK